MGKHKPIFASEADLCASFIAAIGKEWTAYAESAGWDILLSRNADGFQIGIEAKLRCNVDVINQAIEWSGGWPADDAGPDCRAILVPYRESHRFDRIAAYIGVTIIGVRAPIPGGNKHFDFHPSLPKLPGRYSSFDHWHEWAPTKRYKLPDYVPDVAAGSPSPIQLTEWKIAAIKIAITLERRGYVTRADFKRHHIDHRRWLAAESCWLTNRDGRYVPGPRFPNFKGQHPKNYEQIAADAPKWMAAVDGDLFAEKRKSP